MRKKILKITFLLFLTSSLCSATIVEVSITTDKPTYLLGEEVTVFVTAYNPNPEPVTLYFAESLKASYLMDGIFDWTEGKGWPTIPTQVVIDAHDIHTWNLSHGSPEMAIYPLSIGTHTVVGEVVGYGQSAPVEFEVIPEPATVVLFGMGIVWIRQKRYKR